MPNQRSVRLGRRGRARRRFCHRPTCSLNWRAVLRARASRARASSVRHAKASQDQHETGFQTVSNKASSFSLAVRRKFLELRFGPFARNGCRAGVRAGVPVLTEYRVEVVYEDCNLKKLRCDSRSAYSHCSYISFVPLMTSGYARSRTDGNPWLQSLAGKIVFQAIIECNWRRRSP
jgi:hypothetical protein